MQIEEITAELLKGVADDEVKALRFRITQLWGRYFGKEPPVEREMLVEKYRLLREEIVKRKLTFATAIELDHEVVKRAFIKAAEPTPKKEPPKKGTREDYEMSEEWDAGFAKCNEKVKKSLAPGSVLDVGCGSGKLLKQLADEKREVMGFDVNPVAVKMAGEKGVAVKKVDVDAAGLAIDPESYDNVVFVDSVEYLQEPKAVLKQAEAVARKRVIVASRIGGKWKTDDEFESMLPDGFAVDETDSVDGWAMASANKKTVKKAEEEEPAGEMGLMFRITKVDKKQHIVGGIVYEPRAVDSQGDWTDKTEIEQAMYGFMEKYAKNTNRIKVMHKGEARFFPIVEVFQPDTDIKKGDTVVKAGSWWMMVRVTDDEVWDAVEKGALTGFSMGGRASGKKATLGMDMP